MGERLKKYLKRTEELIAYLGRMAEGLQEEGQMSEKASGERATVRGREEFRNRVAKEKAELLVQIGFFQHERLIHLIVTVLFALMTILVFLLAVTNFAPWTGVLLLLLLMLLIPYIRHYWLLENGTQKLYQYYDKLEELYNGED
ncbi:MAG: hypothetical protein IJ006_06795 [Lachnospiraceae bacterium]|nr:hypothetical protein [Lachnospiraceae bacterium]